MRTIETLGIPVVAAINGAALGGGLELALPAIIASRWTPKAANWACRR